MGTLYGKLVIALFGLLCIIGVVTARQLTTMSEMYRQEAAQKLSQDLAAHIVSHNHPLLSAGQVNQPALKGIFDDLMAVNPAIEVYLLDGDGTILAFSAPPERVQLQRVNIAPIEQFLSKDTPFPLLGDDPRHPGQRNIFSVAAVHQAEAAQGYLYVILAGEAAVGTMEMVAESQILRQGLWVVGGALVAALIGGLLLFSWLTGRIGRLAKAMETYQRQNGGGRYPLGPGRLDEIDRLGESFNHMADRIDQQVSVLQQTDALRRELVANVSHDLRTPLTTLHGYLETLLLKDDLDRETHRKYLKTALSHSERLSHLVDDLFELARLEGYDAPPGKEPFSMAELIQDVVQQFAIRAQDKQILLRAELGDDSPMVAGDIGMVQRVLENLIENALRHTPKNGRVSVSTHVDDGKIFVRVVDTGCGIPEPVRQQVFDRFAQAEGNGNGSAGLGLAIVKRSVELHGGDVGVTATPGGGATFSFSLPALGRST
jgi:signal transduction histidine kinase